MHIAALSRSNDERRERVNAVWSVDADQRAAAQGWYWMAHPMVRARINTLISGDPECDAYGRLERLYREQRWQLPIADAVSLGCGFGNLERDLAGRGLVRRIIAYDLAEKAVAQARRLAAEAGLTGLRYEVADLDALALPPASADAVFTHQSVHHVENLETLYATIRDALRPGGVFHLHEFVGPTRFQWTDAQLDLVNGLLDELPPRLRRLPSGAPKPAVRCPTVAEMIAADPSEAIRSADIPSALKSCFEIVEARPIGGAVLHLALGDIAQNFDPNSAEDRCVLEHFFAVEDRAMREGVIGSDFVIITAVPRRATAAVFAADRTAEVQGRAVRHSLTLNTALLFPPVKRLYQAVRSLATTVAGLSAEQVMLRTQQDIMAAELAALARVIEAQSACSGTELPPAPPPSATDHPEAPPRAAASAENRDERDRWCAREMQSAALRHLPFLPGEIEVDPDGISLVAYAGAPEGLTANMAFFVNGHRFDQVEYPIVDPVLQAKFREVRGMGLVMHGRITHHLDELQAARFFRFDASPTGQFVPADWRRAIHFMNPAHERFPLPPTANIQRVIGDTSTTRFAMGGATIFKNLEAYLRETGYCWSDFPRILDWGCGAGRLTRYLISETTARVYGGDIDADNIAWCRSAYPGGEFEVLPLYPPTAFPDESFDLITGLSVLTHLREKDQWAWLEELRRITRPGGLVFLSVQGPTQFAYNNFPAALYAELQEKGFLDFIRDPALDGFIEDSEYYRAAMHARHYIVDNWSRYFEILAIVDAIAGLQDFVALRRRTGSTS